MSSRVITENFPHDEASLLLPWYVNGSLSGKQKTQVEEHVRGCMVCRRELATERSTLKAFRNESPLDQAVQAGFDRLHSRIATRTSPRSRSLPSAVLRLTWNRIQNMVSPFTGARLTAAMAAVPLVVIAIAFGLTFMPQKQSPGSAGYGSTGSSHTPPMAIRPFPVQCPLLAGPDDVSVIFTTGTSIETIEGLLNLLPAKIVAGPNSAGVYTVRLLGVSGEMIARPRFSGFAVSGKSLLRSPLSRCQSQIRRGRNCGETLCAGNCGSLFAGLVRLMRRRNQLPEDSVGSHTCKWGPPGDFIDVHGSRSGKND